MALETGAKLGVYEIVSPLAAEAGMEAYQAKDAAAERTVAIHLIPPEWSAGADPEAWTQRLERAAKGAATLDHPNIRKALEAGQQDGVDFLVLEHVEGQTLAGRLNGKPMNLGEAMEIAIGIGEALEYAHGAGVVHRKLTPASILLTKAGPKLVDFGIAELQPALAAAPGKPANVTAVENARKQEEIASLQYNAPEQFEGKPADTRTDIFAFGSIFYEMVTGKKAFEGKSRAVLIASIATADPDPLAQYQPRASRALDHVVQRCLEKEPDDRWQTMHDCLLQLRWIRDGGATGGAALDDGKGRTLTRVLLAAAALLAVGLAFPAARYLRGSEAVEATQFRIPVTGLSTADIALSPDGQALALVARPNSSEPGALYIRRMGSMAFLKLGGTEDGAQPFWSPDSLYVAFVAGGRLKSVAVAGGAPKDICEAAGFAGGAWNREGTILFGSAKGLFRVSAEGGKAAAVTRPGAAETGHFWPSFLPDGKHFLYLAWSKEPGGRGVFTGSLDESATAKLMATESNALTQRRGSWCSTGKRRCSRKPSMRRSGR